MRVLCKFALLFNYWLPKRDKVIKLLNSLCSVACSLPINNTHMKNDDILLYITMYAVIEINVCLQLDFFLLYFRMQQPLSSSGSTSLQSRRQDMNSPTPSDDSDSDISLGTHSPVPSSLSLQHSPGSTSGGGNDRDDRLQEDRDKDYRSFSLSSFRFDTHSPGMAGE